MKIGSALLSAVAIGKDNINFYAAGVFCTPAAYNIIYNVFAERDCFRQFLAARLCGGKALVIIWQK